MGSSAGTEPFSCAQVGEQRWVRAPAVGTIPAPALLSSASRVKWKLSHSLTTHVGVVVRKGWALGLRDPPERRTVLVQLPFLCTLELVALALCLAGISRVACNLEHRKLFSLGEDASRDEDDARVACVEG